MVRQRRAQAAAALQAAGQAASHSPGQPAPMGPRSPLQPAACHCCGTAAASSQRAHGLCPPAHSGRRLRASPRHCHCHCHSCLLHLPAQSPPHCQSLSHCHAQSALLQHEQSAHWQHWLRCCCCCCWRRRRRRRSSLPSPPSSCCPASRQQGPLQRLQQLLQQHGSHPHRAPEPH